MSIPTPFNPLGTLGAVARKPSGYVEDGLVYWLDVLADGTGVRTKLTELVSAEKVPCQTEGYEPPTVGVDGVLRGRIAVPFGNFVASQGYYVELVACPWTARFAVGAFATRVSAQYNSKFPQVGFDNKESAISGVSIYSVTCTRYMVPEGRRERVSTFAYPSATAAPKCEGADMVSVESSGAVQNYLVYCSDARFCALRIYNRQLSASEAAQNLARDAERWDKNTIIE